MVLAFFVVKNGPVLTRCLHPTFSPNSFPPNSSTRPLTEIECLSMADVPGEFMMPQALGFFGLDPYRRSVLTHRLQDLSTK